MERIVDRRENLRAAGLMSASMAFFTLNDSFMKSLSGVMPLGQALFLRGMLTIALTGILAWRSGALRLPPRGRDGRLVWLRSGAEAAAALLFVGAIFHMPLANAVAILQSLPLTVALAAALIFGEPLGWRRFTAILVGFCGVLLILRPGPEGFNIYALSALGAVVAVTIRDLATRGLSGHIPSLGVAFISAIVVTLASLALSLTTPWVTVSLTSALKLLAASLFIVGAYLTAVMVMRIGDIGAVAPFRYTSLLWGLLLGFLFFGDWPDPATLAGAAIVVATGLFTLYREQVVRQRG